ncbi:MAG: hypothetical protein ABW079_03425 [Sedimenticola sp.]
MYSYFKHYLGERWANILTPIIYSLMMIAVVYCSFESQAEFNYLTL